MSNNDSLLSKLTASLGKISTSQNTNPFSEFVAMDTDDHMLELIVPRDVAEEQAALADQADQELPDFTLDHITTDIHDEMHMRVMIDYETYVVTVYLAEWYIELGLKQGQLKRNFAPKAIISPPIGEVCTWQINNSLQPACQFYAPGRQDVELFGAEPVEDYPFGVMVDASVCMCREQGGKNLLNGYLFTPCRAVANKVSCDFFKSYPWETVYEHGEFVLQQRYYGNRTLRYQILQDGVTINVFNGIASLEDAINDFKEFLTETYDIKFPKTNIVDANVDKVSSELEASGVS